ncbi:MAG TPA: M48 family metallopeptidase [Polyangiaceae bacterium LLY-WYZ-15_(1-7)]|nr:hypothetical protein [Sandaracinus sp.]HJK92647.1 M48 family metallopeptidase [Polyangiaceae bacterium LLY-WYZ-15_(1-7)]HJL02418.1 M48 family metallopeptidase [Polyangiaceae bacterium LLY-WYZ-15_(1-7)]HJL11708.1 M48 family metallopeptidase [Polyangiaceae bacterium LLY-WYZ-15_(1-7)]HJL27697.1 M48 family metallopeptidase [Polyangiaceae bacterium LLY-WYZ-15_(1-7)]
MADFSAPASESSFQRYVTRRETGIVGGTEEHSRYAYGADLAMLRTFKRLKPVELVVSSVVRTYKGVLRNQYLGTTVRVGPRQLPRIHRIAKECAETLGVPLPTVYVANSPFMNAYTFGTDEDSFVVVHSKLVDDFTDEELKFVIGHEMGHVQNKHVVYGTALRLLKMNVGVWLRWIAPPAEAALLAWARRAEITCDRAGLLCCLDVDVAMKTFMKMACGSARLYDELDVDVFLEQLDAGREGVGRFTELMASHPYLPKRIQALRLFAESELYRGALGLEGGRPLGEIDAEVNEFLQVVRGKKSGGKRGAAPAPLPEGGAQEGEDA